MGDIEKAGNVLPEQIAEVAHSLIIDIRSLIDSGKAQVAQAVNQELVMLYWSIGHRIRNDIMHQQRAEYGQQVVTLLGAQLTQEYGRGFSNKNLFRMIGFVEAFSSQEIVSTLSRQLSWSHFLELLPVRDSLEREFYAEMCRIEHWSVRALRSKIDGMLYQRTAISRKPDPLIRTELDALRTEDRLTPDLVFRDPYFLDFLGLEDAYSEQDLETAILRELERFLLELGTGFAFLARQKRMSVGGEDFYLDLLFFHRNLHCLVAVDLKLGRFTASHKGQMELYLRWLEANEQRSDENPPLGLVLCSAKNEEQVKLLQLDSGHIRVAEYMMELPQRDVLTQKIHEAVRRARIAAEARLLDKGSIRE